MATVSIHEHEAHSGWALISHGTRKGRAGGWICIQCGADLVTLHYEFDGNLACVLRSALAQIDANCDDQDDGVDLTTCAGSDHDPDGSKANVRTVVHEEET